MGQTLKMPAEGPVKYVWDTFAGLTGAVTGLELQGSELTAFLLALAAIVAREFFRVGFRALLERFPQLKQNAQKIDEQITTKGKKREGEQHRNDSQHGEGNKEG